MKRFMSIFFAFLLLFTALFVSAGRIYAEGEDNEEVLETEETIVQEEADLPAEEILPEEEEIQELILPETDEIQETRVELTGDAYAVIQSNGQMVFTRSSNTYDNASTGTLVDLKGNEYTGTIFTGVESTGVGPTTVLPWKGYETGVTSIVAADTIRPVSMYNWFKGFSNLESFDSENFDTSGTESMVQVFYSCKKLTDLDLSHFITSNVKSMAGMFRGCETLEKIDLKNFDTRNVVSMDQLFLQCNALKDLDISSFDTSNVNNFGSMFYYCKSLETIDITHFNTGNAVFMGSMFAGCQSLTSIDLSKLNTANVYGMQSMFSNCISLESLDLSKFDTSSVDGRSLGMNGMFNSCYKLEFLDLSSFDTSSVENMEKMFYRCDSLKTVKLGNKWTKWTSEGYLPQGVWTNTVRNLTKTNKELYSDYPASASAWSGTWTFIPAYAILQENGHLVFTRSSETHTNGSEGTLTDRKGNTFTGKIFTVFEGNKELHPWKDNATDKAAIKKVYAYDVIMPTSMDSWFSLCNNLESFDGTNFDTSETWDMAWMLDTCNNLTEVNMSGFDTRKARYLNGIFNACQKLTSVDLSSFETPSVEYCYVLFQGCYNLTSVDLSNFDTSKVKNMGGMFNNCFALDTVKLGKKWTVWADDNMLPSGTWHNYAKYLTKTEKELQEGYPANAEAWAGTWTTKELVYSKPKLVSIYNSANGADIRFDLVEGIDTYYLMQKYNGTWKSIKTLKVGTEITKAGDHYKVFDTSIKDSYGKGYIYSIAIKDGEGNLLYNTKGLPLYRLKQPTIKSTKSSSKGKVTITWSKENCHGYEVQYSLDGKNWTKAPRINSGSTTTQTISGLTSGKKYYFRIRCQKTNADRGTTWSQYSEWSSVKVK